MDIIDDCIYLQCASSQDSNLINNCSMFNSTSQQQYHDDYKKNRDARMEQMRKNNREEMFSKRRNILASQNGAFQQQSIEPQPAKKDRLLIVDQNLRGEIESFLRSNYSMEIFTDLVKAINEGNIVNQHYGIIGIRKILSIAENPPIQAVIDAGLIPKMIAYVKQTQYPQLQLEATWALTNVASGTTVQCQSIIDKGGIPLFVELLKSPNMGIVEQAVWAIGNISSDCVFYRDTVLRAGGLANLVEVTKRVSNDEVLIKHCCWALSNLCRGSPLPKYDNIKPAIPVLCQLIGQGRLNDKQILADCCWAISYHSDANRNKIQIVVESGVIPRIIRNLEEPAIGLLIPSIRILGNISTGSVDHTNQLLHHNVLPSLQKVLDHHKKVVRREACWVLSNITAGSRAQVQAVISCQPLIKRILELFDMDANDVKRQVCYIFSNMAHSGDPETIYNLYREAKIIRYYVNILSLEDSKALEVALECLFIILAHGEKFKINGKNQLVEEVHSQGASAILQKLQYHKSDLVYDHVSKILQHYFQIEDPLGI